MDRATVPGLKKKGARKTAETLVYSFLLSLLILCTAPSALRSDAACAGTWPGVDETVVEKFAGEHGREAREPLINTDQGDLLLFAFLIAGVIGGFTAGYYWRMLLEGKAAGRDGGKGKKR